MCDNTTNQITARNLLLCRVWLANPSPAPPGLRSPDCRRAAGSYSPALLRAQSACCARAQQFVLVQAHIRSSLWTAEKARPRVSLIFVIGRFGLLPEKTKLGPAGVVDRLVEDTSARRLEGPSRAQPAPPAAPSRVFMQPVFSAGTKEAQDWRDARAFGIGFGCNRVARAGNLPAIRGGQTGGVKKLISNARSLTPYLLVEILLPGGTLIALALWLSVNWRKWRARPS